MECPLLCREVKLLQSYLDLVLNLQVSQRQQQDGLYMERRSFLLAFMRFLGAEKGPLDNGDICFRVGMADSLCNWCK